MSLLVLGNAGLDLGLAVPHLPREGETVVGRGMPSAPGGKGLNQAVVAARTGLVPVTLMAALGADAEGERVAAVLRGEALTLRPAYPGPATDVSVLMVLPGGENGIVTAGACAAALPAEAAGAAVAGLPAGAWLLLQGNLSAETSLESCRQARAGGVRVMLNTAPLQWDQRTLIGQCDVVVANRIEAQLLTGDAGEAAAAALRGLGAGVAIVTLGAAGCVVASEQEVVSIPAPAVRAVDSTGAGDTFCGVLAACLAAGWALGPGVAVAQAAAACTVQRQGCFAALPTRPELAALLIGPCAAATATPINHPYGWCRDGIGN